MFYAYKRRELASTFLPGLERTTVSMSQLVSYVRVGAQEHNVNDASSKIV